MNAAREYHSYYDFALSRPVGFIVRIACDDTSQSILRTSHLQGTTHLLAVHCCTTSVVHLTLDGVNGKWRWRRNLCQIDGENSKLRRQSSEFSDGNAVIYDRYLRCHFRMTPNVHNNGRNTSAVHTNPIYKVILCITLTLCINSSYVSHVPCV